MLDSAQSPQPQIRIRKEPFKPQNMPTNLGKYEEKLLKAKDDQEFPRTDTEDSNTHQRHFSIENPQPAASQALTGLSSRSKRVLNQSDNESKLTTLQQREKNLTSPKNSWKNTDLRQNTQKFSKQDPKFRQSFIQRDTDPTMAQHRQSIYSSLDKSQTQIPSSKLKH